MLANSDHTSVCTIPSLVMSFYQIAFKYFPAFLLCLTLASAHAFEATVVGISDGDTITVLDSRKTQHKIRLAGIDAPEKGQDFGNKSKEYLSDLVYKKVVNIVESHPKLTP